MFQVILTVAYLKPSVETHPAMNPVNRAAHNPMFISANVPTATPAASVAFWT